VDALIRVLILDDHSVVREGLRALLGREGDIEVIAEATRLEDAAAVASEPDVIIADLILGDVRGGPVIAALRERFASAGILVLTMTSEPDDVQTAFAAGADGYTLKEAAARDLVEAIRRVHRGEGYVEPSLGAALLARVGRTEGRQARGPLTVREQQTLRLLALGFTNSETAERLGISRRTVEAHRASLLRKLNARSRADLVRLAIDQSVITTRELSD
jgi:two-component system, NarL family, response regulator NreC